MIPLTPSVEDIPKFQTIRIVSTPVICQLIDKMGLIERIDKLSPVKAKDCNVSVDTRIAALIINPLSDRKPLFKRKNPLSSRVPYRQAKSQYR